MFFFSIPPKLRYRRLSDFRRVLTSGFCPFNFPERVTSDQGFRQMKTCPFKIICPLKTHRAKPEGKLKIGLGTVGIQPKKRCAEANNSGAERVWVFPYRTNRSGITGALISMANLDGVFLGERQKTGSATPKQLLKSLAEVARNAVPLNLRIAKMEDPDQLIPTFQAVKYQKKRIEKARLSPDGY
jgi:hypothetical protein